LLSPTSVNVALTNIDISPINVHTAWIYGLVFNNAQAATSNIATVTYGSLNKGGIFSKSTIRNTNTFYGVKSFYVSNENILDFSLSLIAGQIAADSQNSNMVLLIVDYIIFESI
jgi:hypothetical protein